MLRKEKEVREVYLACRDREDCLDILDQKDPPDNAEKPENLEDMDKKGRKEQGAFKVSLDIPEHLVFLASLDKPEPLDLLVLLAAMEQRVSMGQADQVVFLDGPESLETMV
jgi:hypothetical protein